MMGIPKFTANSSPFFLHCDLNWPFLLIFKETSPIPPLLLKREREKGGGRVREKERISPGPCRKVLEDFTSQHFLASLCIFHCTLLLVQYVYYVI